MVTAAREDNRRLERRMDQLRTAVAEFEAHTGNLAEVAADRARLITDMIDQEVKPPKTSQRSAPTVDGPATPLSAETTVHEDTAGEDAPDSEPREELADPDGSGQLPGKRPARATLSHPTSETGGEDEVDLRSDLEEHFVYDGATNHPDRATDTIYQRRGGGIRRRVAAIETPDSNE